MFNVDAMKILFIQPHTTVILESRWGAFSRKINFFPNLSTQQLAALTPKEFKIKVLDERHKDINYNESGDLVVIHFKTEDADKSYEIADKFRQNGKRVVLAGWHPTALPDEAKQHADSVMVGENEITWPKLLEDYKKGSLQPFYIQEQPVDPDIIPAARRNIGDSCLPIARIQATRGCPYNCEFCRIPAMEGIQLRKRPIENVIKELKSIPQKFLYFSDGSLTIDPDHTKSLFKEMKGLRKKFCCSGNPDVLGDDEFLKLAKSAGCMAWYIGFESLSKETISAIGKKTNKIEDYPEIIKNVHDHKMAVFASFIFGFDTDTVDLFKETIKKGIEWDMDVIETNTLTPFPGTRLYKRFEKEGRIITKEWYKYNEGDVVFKLKNMDEKVFDKECRGIGEYFFTPINELTKFKKSLKLGLYPFITTVFQTHFW